MSKVSKNAPTPAKSQPPAPGKAAFDPKQWAKNGVSEEEVTASKLAFDLFDSDQGGSVDINGTDPSKLRAQSRHDFSGIRVQERRHLPDALRHGCRRKRRH
jgi:hypothetical protein